MTYFDTSFLVPLVLPEATRARFEGMVRESFEVLTPGAADFDLARRHVIRFETGLRAGDALHLAVAENQGAEAICSLDKLFIRAGTILGLPVSTGA